MKELSLHIVDIANNSSAFATWQVYYGGMNFNTHKEVRK